MARLIDADALETDTEYDMYIDDFMSYSREAIGLLALSALRL